MPCGAFLPGCSSLATVLLLPEVDGWPGSPFLALDARSASCLARLSAFISALVFAGLSEGAAADSGDGAVVEAAGLEAGAEGGAGASTGEGMGEGTVTEAERKKHPRRVFSIKGGVRKPAPYLPTVPFSK